MKHRSLLRPGALAALIAVGGTLTSIAPAQFDFGGGDAKPWESMKLNPKTRVKLDFRNAGIDSILNFYQRTSGITIVKDPGLTGTLTVTSAKPVPLSEAFQILSTTLSLKQFDLRKDGNLLVIRRREQRPQGGFDPAAMAQAFQPPQAALKVYPIQFANASQVARVVNDVFSSQGGGGGGFNPFQFFGGGGGGQGGQGGGFRFGGGGQGGRPGGGGGFGGFGGLGRQQSTVRASSDDFSNSVIVNAPDREQRQVEDLIKQLDKQTDQPQRSKVFKLQYASSDELAPVIQNVLVSNAPTGRGGIGGQNVPFEQRIQQAFRFGSTQAAFGQVVSEPRTNSIVVTATEQNLGLIDQVVKELDTEIKLASSTFVFPLANARADNVATLLNQAFGTRQGAGNTGFRGTTNQANRNTTTNRNNQNRNNTFGGGGQNRSPESPTRGVSDPSGRSLDVPLADPNAEAGELETQIQIAQNFGGFFGGGGQNRGGQQGRGQGGTITGRDEQGRLVNVRDLTGQVTTIPDPNTNSIIVVTTPENAELIRGILTQLDQIPEQVMIETLIVEATLDETNRFGVEWKFSARNQAGVDGVTGTSQTGFGLQNANPPLEGFRYTLAGGNLETFINALKQDTKFEVLSTPRIFTSNNVEAQINISQSVPYVLSTREDANGNLTFNYAFQDVGIILTVTPRITSNGYVTMDVTQTANELQGFTDFNAPIVNQRQADTTVSVRDGETIILGGIIRSTVSSTVKKVPLLGDIPVLGQLFRSNSKTKNKTELLVFLTPRIVRDPEEAKRLREQEQSRMPKGIREKIEQNIAPKPPVAEPEKKTGTGTGGTKTGGGGNQR